MSDKEMIDCVQMKNQIQKKILKDIGKLTEENVLRYWESQKKAIYENFPDLKAGIKESSHKGH